MMDKNKSGTADEEELKNWLRKVVGWDQVRIDEELWNGRWVEYNGVGVPFDAFLMAVVEYAWPVDNLEQAEEATGSGAMWQLTLKVVQAKHLPRTDLLGGVDPYVEVRFHGQKYKTVKQKNTYDPLWDPPAQFIFDIHDPDTFGQVCSLRFPPPRPLRLVCRALLVGLSACQSALVKPCLGH